MKESNKKTVEIFSKMEEKKAVFTMVLPTIFAQLIVLCYSIADTFFLGKTNNPNMVAAVSLLLPIYNLTLPLANMAGVGGGTLMSMLIARGEGDEAKKVSCASFYLCLCISLIYVLIFAIFLSPILHLLGASDIIFEYAKIYTIFVIIFGAIPTCLTNTMAALIRSCGFSKEAGFGITLGGVLNIIFDPIFMFVIFDKGMEVEGAAIATLLSNIISMVYFFIVSNKIKNESSICYDLKIGLPKLSNIKELFFIGIPASINTLFFDLDYIILDKLMSTYGAVSLAALGIVLKAERLPLNIGVGICQGMVPLVAFNNEAKDFKRMKKIIGISFSMGIIVAIVSIIMYQSFAPYIMRFFINDINTVKEGTIFLRFRSIATIFMFISFYFNYIFQAFKKGHICMIMANLRWLFLNIPLLFILNHIFGKFGLVMTQALSDIIIATISICLYKRIKKEKNIA